MTVKKNILIVEDNPTNIDILVDILIDFEKQVAINGEEAIEIACDTQPDLILLDIMMPKMSGYDVCKKLRENKATKDIPVIFLTAKNSEEDIVKGFDVGGQDFVSKPFLPRELLARVQTQLLLKQRTDALHKLNQTLEDKVIQRTEELYNAKEKAEESDRLKSAFLMNMSHEIRTPLNAINGFSDILASSVTDTSLHEYVEFIKEGSDRLINTVNDIIDASIIQKKQFKLHKECISLIDILDEFIENQKYKYAKSSPEIHFYFENKLINSNVQLNTDKYKFLSVLTKLLDNSFKFTDNGTVSLCCGEIDNYLEISISDTGRGIDEKKLKVIFDFFRQGDDDYLARNYEGLGLGLPISKAIIDEMGYKLLIKTVVGEGTEVKILIPKFEEQTNLETQKKENNNISIVKSSNLPKILIVEDDFHSRLFLETILEPKASFLKSASNGRECLQDIENTDFEIVFMDIKLPDISGLDLIPKVREKYPGAIVICQSGFAMQSDIDKAIEIGANYYLSKPISQNKVYQLLSSICW